MAARNAFAMLATADSSSEDEVSVTDAPAAPKNADPTKGRGRRARLRRKRRAAAARIGAVDVAQAFDTVTANVSHELSYGFMDVYLMDVVETWVTRMAAPKRFVDAAAHRRVVLGAVAELRTLLAAIAQELTVDGVTQLVTLKPMTMTMAGYTGSPSRYHVRAKDFLRVIREVARRVRAFTVAPASYANQQQVAALTKAAAAAEAATSRVSQGLAVLEVAAARHHKVVIAQRRAAKRGLVAGKAKTGGESKVEEVEEPVVSSGSQQRLKVVSGDSAPKKASTKAVDARAHVQLHVAKAVAKQSVSGSGSDLGAAA